MHQGEGNFASLLRFWSTFRLVSLNCKISLQRFCSTTRCPTTTKWTSTSMTGTSWTGGTPRPALAALEAAMDTDSNSRIVDKLSGCKPGGVGTILQNIITRSR